MGPDKPDTCTWKKCTLAYETLRKGYSKRRNSCRKERKKQYNNYILQNYVHVKVVQGYIETKPQWLSNGLEKTHAHEDRH